MRLLANALGLFSKLTAKWLVLTVTDTIQNHLGKVPMKDYQDSAVLWPCLWGTVLITTSDV